MDFEQIIASMPVGLERSLARTMTFHKGELAFITREALLEELRRQPGLAKTDDRKMRLAIQSLRDKGLRICHMERRENDAHGNLITVFGYFLAKTEQEYQEFRLHYNSYAQTIWRSIKAMDEMRPVITPSGDLEPPPETAVQEHLF